MQPIFWTWHFQRVDVEPMDTEKLISDYNLYLWLKVTNMVYLHSDKE